MTTVHNHEHVNCEVLLADPGLTLTLGASGQCPIQSVGHPGQVGHRDHSGQRSPSSSQSQRHDSYGDEKTAFREQIGQACYHSPLDAHVRSPGAIIPPAPGRVKRGLLDGQGHDTAPGDGSLTDLEVRAMIRLVMGDQPMLATLLWFGQRIGSRGIVM